MKLVKFDPTKHYGMLCDWWAAHEWPAMPLDHLPTATGYVVENAAGPICAGFIYYSGTAMSHMEWLVTNPHAGLRERSDALDVLVSGIKLLAQQAGAKSIFMSLRSRGLIGRLTEKHGFTVTDEGMTNLIGRL